MSIFSNLFSAEKKESLDKGLEKTKESFFGKLGKALVGKSTVDDEVLDNLEEILISSDVGVNTTLKIIKRLEQRVAQDKYLGTSELNRILKEEIGALLSESNTGNASDFSIPEGKKPYVIMVVGVNGVGRLPRLVSSLPSLRKMGRVSCWGRRHVSCSCCRPVKALGRARRRSGSS
jgi:fused signal recognition particle receptor